MHSVFDDDSSEGKLFSFAVIADSHLNPHDDYSNSPWRSNQLANARSQRAVEELNRIAPEFVVHLGDLVHPVPALPSYSDAAQRFHEIYAKLDRPMHLVPGNHDVGDKPGEWLPAQSINRDFLTTYRATFGADYDSFGRGDCHFVILNAQLLNSGLPEEAEQREWLINDLALNAEQRLFVFMHYPPFISDADELDHYDNIDEPARSWLLELLDQYNTEALFAGHVHNFFYNRYKGTHHYIAPSLAFVRQDYSEMFRIAPEADQEFGRNDIGKLGFFIVDVYPDRHTVRVIRDYFDDETQITSAHPDAIDDAQDLLTRLPSVASAPSRLGIDARQVWTERTEIPYGGVVDEFARKPVRSDYPLMALWEMGIQRLRVPLHDLVNPETRQRMVELGEIGHKFQVFSSGIPAFTAQALLTDHAELFSGIEIIQAPSQIDQPEQIEALRKLRESTGIKVFLSALHTSAHGSHGGDGYAHFIRHGFNSSDRDRLIELSASHGDAISGFAFTVMRDENPADALTRINAIASELDLDALALVRLCADLPGDPLVEDSDNIARAAQAAFAAHCSERVDITLDTFADVDRGYFPRNGLTDRRYNLRSAGRVVKNLATALPSALDPGTEFRAGGTGELSWMSAGDCLLVVPVVDEPASTGPDGFEPTVARTAASADFLVDLDHGYSVPTEGSSPGLLTSAVLLHQGPILAHTLS